MKTNEMIQDIHEKVTQIRLHQATQTEKISNMEERQEKHEKAIKKLEANDNKLLGAGIFVTFGAALLKLWEGLFG